MLDFRLIDRNRVESRFDMFERNLYFCKITKIIKYTYSCQVTFDIYIIDIRDSIAINLEIILTITSNIILY